MFTRLIVTGTSCMRRITLLLPRDTACRYLFLRGSMMLVKADQLRFVHAVWKHCRSG